MIKKSTYVFIKTTKGTFVKKEGVPFKDSEAVKKPSSLDELEAALKVLNGMLRDNPDVVKVLREVNAALVKAKLERAMDEAEQDEARQQVEHFEKVAGSIPDMDKVGDELSKVGDEMGKTFTKVFGKFGKFFGK
jgi:cob(I)alamin adenosyltransferase